MLYLEDGGMPIATRIFQIAFSQSVFVVLLGWAAVASQFVQAQAVNPLQSDPKAVEIGGTIFRAQCSSCHGADAKGIDTINAPDLTLIWSRVETSDESVFRTIRDGIAGSIMPPHGFPDMEVWMLVSYLRSVAVKGIGEIAGNADRGAELFNDYCARCHRVDGTGGSLGPNLSNITQQRLLDALFLSVRNPSVSIAPGYKPIVFLTTENERVLAIIKSEDAFSLQVMDSNQTLRGFTKSELLEITRDGQSLMPAFPENLLSEPDFLHILSYLQSDRDL
jgi:putative heme-binding domain-containing protein